MATYEIPMSNSTIHGAVSKSGSSTSVSPATTSTVKRGGPGAPSVLVIATYFLALASIAVVAVGGQFPWFTVAPATILSLIAYFRHVEATLERKATH